MSKPRSASPHLVEKPFKGKASPEQLQVMEEINLLKLERDEIQANIEDKCLLLGEMSS